MKLHLLSGLGADSRVFKFLDLPGIEKCPIEWITPLETETISDYTQRLARNLMSEEPLNLLGVSFGGIIAQELSRHLKIRRLIIVSSIKSPSEMGLAFHITKRLRIFKLFSPSKMKEGIQKMGPRLFSLQTDSEIQLFRQITEETEDQFLRWAVRQLHTWKIPEYEDQIIHIHGTKDRMFPVGKIRNFIPIDGGGHFMIVNRAKEISQIIVKKLA